LSRTSIRLSTVSQIVFLILLALVSLGFTASFVLIFLIPVMGWFIWRDHSRISELEKRLAALEGPKPAKPEQP
jgi:hypothetical protein